VRRPADDDDTPLTSGWRRKRARTASDADDGEEEADWTFDEDVHPDVETDGVACSDLLGRQQHVEHSEGGEEEEILKVEPSDVESVTSYTVGSTTTIGRSDVESIASYSVTGQEDVVADAAPGAPPLPGDEARRTSRPGGRRGSWPRGQAPVELDFELDVALAEAWSRRRTSRPGGRRGSWPRGQAPVELDFELDLAIESQFQEVLRQYYGDRIPNLIPVPERPPFDSDVVDEEIRAALEQDEVARGGPEPYENTALEQDEVARGGPEPYENAALEPDEVSRGGESEAGSEANESSEPDENESRRY